MSRLIKYAVGFLLISYGLLLVVPQFSKILFEDSDKKKTWNNIKRSRGTYSGGADLNWVNSICRDMEVKVKLKNSCTEDKLDLAYEIKAKLTRPIFSESSGISKADYRVDVLFKFIDEDGFVLACRRKLFPDYMDEKNEDTNLHYSWENQKSEYIIIRGIICDFIDAKTASKTTEINYMTEIILEK